MADTKDQAYFFTEKWQKAIKTSEKAIKEGKYSAYSSAKNLQKNEREADVVRNYPDIK